MTSIVGLLIVEGEREVEGNGNGKPGTGGGIPGCDRSSVRARCRASVDTSKTMSNIMRLVSEKPYKVLDRPT
jgi:hypothetical protein